MPTEKVKQIKVPSEKQVTLLEKLMAHELEDVQKKAQAIVLSIWKKKNVQEKKWGPRNPEKTAFLFLEFHLYFLYISM